MPEPNNPGQPPASPPGTPPAQPAAQPPIDPGKPGTPPDPNALPGDAGDTPPATPPGEKPPEPPAGTGEVPDFIEKDGVKYYKAFDKHPEWRELKDNKTAIQGILDENGYRNLDELISDLQSGRSLADLLGTNDANTVQSLLDKSAKWDAAEEYWAEQKAKQLEEGETKEETITRLKKEKKELEDARRTDADKFTHTEEARRQIEAFNRDVSDMVDSVDGLTDAEKSVLRLHLGVDNPMDEVTIGDRKAVRSTAQGVISKFTEFVKAVRQSAVDEYVKGQSKIIPTPQPGAEQSPVVTEQRVDVSKTSGMEEAFSTANKLILEQLKGMQGV